MLYMSCSAWRPIEFKDPGAYTMIIAAYYSIGRSHVPDCGQSGVSSESGVSDVGRVIFA